MTLDEMGGDRGSQRENVLGHHLSSSGGCTSILVCMNGCHHTAPRSSIHTVNVRLELCKVVVLQVPKDEDGLQTLRQEPDLKGTNRVERARMLASETWMPTLVLPP